jgi:hypothetical protein
MTRFLFVLLIGATCDHEPPEHVAVLPDGRTAHVDIVAPEWARSPTWFTSTPTVVCSGPGECREVIAMRPCPAPGSMICFDADQTKCLQCRHEKVILRLGAQQGH